MGEIKKVSNVEVKTKRQNLFLIFENDHSKVRMLVQSRLENQRISHGQPSPRPTLPGSQAVVACAS